MPKRELKVGDRVRVYGPIYKHEGAGIQNGKLICEIVKRYSTSCNFVCRVIAFQQFGINLIPVGSEIYCHEKQIRRLRRKAETVSVTREQLAEMNELIRRLTNYADCLILRLPDRKDVNYKVLNDGRDYLARLAKEPK